MPIVGFTFLKMNAEHKAPPTGKMSVDNNIAIKNVEERSLSFGKENHSGLRFTFEFSVKYKNDELKKEFGTILLNGEVLFYDAVEKMKAITDEWKKSKKVPADVAKQLLNTTMNRCNMAALNISKDVNLPPPFPLPRVRSDQVTGQ